MIVTITGADDAVDPRELANLSRYYRVEWGILYSLSRRGSARYPSEAWIRALDRYAMDHGMQLALHLCGASARETIGGEFKHIGPLIATFKRFQLNGYQPANESVDVMAKVGAAFILQAHDETNFEVCRDDAPVIGNGTTVLYDPSGGTGVRYRDWPESLDARGVPFGIAGGIGPDNVVDALAAAERLGASWIDMESGVRTDDRFDLDKVHDVLERAARWSDAQKTRPA